MSGEGQAPAVQPGAAEGGPESQGAGGGAGLYDLQAAPPEMRPYLEAELKKIEANATKKFEEAASHRKQWEPYENLGLADIPPEELEQLIQFRQVASDQDAFVEWWNAVGDQYGLFDEDEGESGEEVDDDGQLTPEKLEALLKEQLDQRLAPVEQQLSQADQEQRFQAAQQEVENQLGALREKHGDGFDEARVCQLALAYDDTPDAIERGYKDWLEITGQAERGLVEQKLNQPDPAETGGTPATGGEPITDFGSAKRAAAQRFAAAG